MSDRADNRKMAALRGDTRDRLDDLLLTELMGTGIGRSAFIQAMIDHFRAADEAERDLLIDRMSDYQRRLP